MELRKKKDHQRMKEKDHPFRKYLNGHEPTVGRNTNDKDILTEVLMKMRNLLLDSEEKTILVIKRQRTCLNYIQVVVFCGRQNLQTMKLNI